MRDNWNIDELSDQAWNKMREMLDQEMPVQGDSRKPIVFWWFWAAAAVMLIGTIGFLLFRPVGSSESEDALANISQDRQELPAKADELRNSADLSNSTQSGEQTDSNIAAQEIPAKTFKNNKAVTTTKTNLDEATSRLGRIEIKAATESESSTVQLENERSEEQLKSNGGPENEENITQEILSQGEANIARNNSTQAAIVDPARVESGPDQAVFTLENLPAQTIAMLQQEPLQLSRINEYNPKRPLLVPLEINAGLIAGLESGGIVGGMTELRTGLFLHNTAKWSFQTGVGFHLQQDPFRISFKNSGNVSADRAESPTNMDNLNNYDPGQGPVFQSMSLSQVVASSDIDVRTLYLDVPLLIDWQFAPKWSVAAGGRLSWLLSTRWKETSRAESISVGGAGADFNLALNNGKGAYAVYRIGNNSTTTTLILNKFYASGTFGLTFRPAAGWNIRLQYQHSLTNQLDNSVYQKTDRSLWLSAGLRF